MPDDHFPVVMFAIFTFAIGIKLIIHGFREHLFSQKMKNTATTKIGSAPVGLVEIAGHAACTEPEISPVSKTPCVFWRVTVHDACWFYKEPYGHEPQYQRQSNKPFYVQDDTGRVLVDPAGAEIVIPPDRKYNGSYKKYKEVFSFKMPAKTMLDAPALQFIDTLSEHTKNVIRKCEYVLVSEYFIAPDDQVYVIGNAAPYDEPEDAENRASLIIRKHTNDSTMYIADMDEKKLIETHLKWTYPKMITGFSLSTCSLFVMLFLLLPMNVSSYAAFLIILLITYIVIRGRIGGFK